jgi:hypothetical protein
VDDIRHSVDNVIEEMHDDFYNEPMPKDPAQVVRDITTLREFRNDVKREKNNFVRACNALGRQYVLL